MQIQIKIVVKILKIIIIRFNFNNQTSKLRQQQVNFFLITQIIYNLKGKLINAQMMQLPWQMIMKIIIKLRRKKIKFIKIFCNNN